MTNRKTDQDKAAFNPAGVGGDDAFLDALFNEARGARAQPLSPDFAARLAADAERAVPRRAAVPSRLTQPGWLTRLRTALNELGGAPGAAGLLSAGLAGVWLGFAPPQGAEGLVQGLIWTTGAETDSTIWDDEAGLGALITARLED